MIDDKAYRYDYRELDRFLSEEHGPQLLSEQIEELMSACGDGAGFVGELGGHFHTLGRLRDLFRKTHPRTAAR